MAFLKNFGYRTFIKQTTGLNSKQKTTQSDFSGSVWSRSALLAYMIFIRYVTIVPNFGTITIQICKHLKNNTQIILIHILKLICCEPHGEITCFCWLLITNAQTSLHTHTTNQHLCCSLPRKCNNLTWYKHKFKVLPLLHNNAFWRLWNIMYLKILWKMEQLLFWSKCSIFHNIFKSIQN